MANSSVPPENVNASMLLDKLLDLAQALLGSIQQLEDMVEREKRSFQRFLEAKLFRHHKDMEHSLEGLREEVHSLCDQVSALEISRSGNAQHGLGGAASSAALERKRTCRSRGSDDVGHGRC